MGQVETAYLIVVLLLDPVLGSFFAFIMVIEVREFYGFEASQVDLKMIVFW